MGGSRRGNEDYCNALVQIEFPRYKNTLLCRPQNGLIAKKRAVFKMYLSFFLNIVILKDNVLELFRNFSF